MYYCLLSGLSADLFIGVTADDAEIEEAEIEEERTAAQALKTKTRNELREAEG
jgi:hypothetical protein